MKWHFIVILSSFLNDDLVKQLKIDFLKAGRGKILNNAYNLWEANESLQWEQK